MKKIYLSGVLLNNFMHVIFAQSFFYPDYSAGSQMLSDLSFFLAENDFNVCVVTSRRMYDGRSVSLPSYEEINKVNVYRPWSSNFGRRTFVGRFVDYISLEISLTIKLFLLTKRNDIVVLMTDPPLLNVITYPFVVFKGGMVVNWLQDLFPEVAVGAGIFSKYSFLNRVLTNVRNKVLVNADKNIVIGSRMYEYLADIGINSEKIVRIPNWADGNAIKPLPQEDNYIRKRWGLEDKFVVGYSGNLGRAHDVSTFSKAIQHLQSDDNIAFLFIGGGVGIQKLKTYVEENKLDNVVFQPYQSRELLHLSLNVADVHWVTLEPHMEGFIVPSKIYGIFAAGKPVIFLGDEDGEIAKDIERIGCGVSIKVGDDEKLVRVIKAFSKDVESVQKMGKRGRKCFQKEYDLPISAHKFVGLFHDMHISGKV